MTDETELPAPDTPAPAPSIMDQIDEAIGGFEHAIIDKPLLAKVLKAIAAVTHPNG